jgi:required for meiotic nuclear division protein 1
VFELKQWSLQAWCVTKEIDLNALAQHCGMLKRYTWEEPIKLDHILMDGMFGIKAASDSQVLLFSYGAIVSVNGNNQWVPVILEYLSKHKICQTIGDWQNRNDDYTLIESTDTPVDYEDDRASFPVLEPYHMDLAAVALAKTVALERIEEQITSILETAESIIDRLESGRIRMGDRKLASLTARVLRHEYDSISYILILDKPDITWSYPEAWEFYDKLAEIFELSDRYAIIRQKTETLRHIIDGFTVISHSFRGLFVELVIVILILLEIVLMVLEYLK